MSDTAQDVLDSRPAVYKRHGNISPADSRRLQAALQGVVPCPRPGLFRKRSHRWMQEVQESGGSWLGQPGVTHYVCTSCGDTSTVDLDFHEMR